MHLGAALAGRLDDLAGPFTAFGIPLGSTFQMRDDLLGVFGDPAVTGKPVGDDLREGKLTPLLAAATDLATGAQADLLARAGSPDLGADEIAALQDLLVELGAVDEVERTHPPARRRGTRRTARRADHRRGPGRARAAGDVRGLARRLSATPTRERRPQHRPQPGGVGEAGHRLHQRGGAERLDVGVVGRVVGGERVGQASAPVEREHRVAGVDEVLDVVDRDVAAAHEQPHDRRRAGELRQRPA